jgi:DNA-binding CsgD family transcriptional regulator
VSILIPQIIDDLYAGTMDDAVWDRALIGIADMVRASATLLLAFNPANGALLRDENHRIDPTLLDDYRRYWTYQDCRRDPFLGVSVGCPVTEEALQIPHWRRTPILNEFLLPGDAPHFMPVWLRKSATKAVTLSLQATRKRGPFDAQDIERLRGILPHVTRAVEIRDRLEAASMKNEVLASCIDRVNFGVIALGLDGKIQHANVMAEKMLRQEPAIPLRADRTLNLNKISASRLCRQLKGQAEDDPQKERLIRIDRGPGRWPISLVIIPMREVPVRWVSADAGCVLFLFDPERHVTPRLELVAKDFGVSTREAEIAVLLSMGLELSGVARRLSISIHTARTHLKSLYGKTGLHSQAELVRRVLSGPSAHASNTD